jgi:hypothetical protein
MVVNKKNLKSRRSVVKLLQSALILQGSSMQKDFVQAATTRAAETNLLISVLTRIELAT